MLLHILKSKSRALVLFATLAAALLSVGGQPHAAAVDQEKSEAYFQEARDYLQRGNINAAIIQLKNALQRDPNNIAARRLLGVAYLRIGKGRSAEKEIRAALRRNATDGGLKLLLGKALLIQGRYQDALGAIADDLTADQAQRAEILLLRGKAFLGLRRYEQAADALREADRLRPEDVRAKVGYAQGLVSQGKTDEAEREVDIALSRNGKSPEALLLKGELRRLKRDLKGAVDRFDRVLAANPGNLLALLGRAAALIDLNRDNEAVADIQAVFRRVPNHPLAHYFNALILAKKKDYIGAQDSLQAMGRYLDEYLPGISFPGRFTTFSTSLNKRSRR